MTREQINKSSLAYIKAITSTLTRRLSEHLGVPYNTDDDEDNGKNKDSSTVNNSKSKDETYPLYNKANTKRYGEYKPKSRNRKLNEQVEQYGDKTVFDGGSADDVRSFFAGFTVG